MTKVHLNGNCCCTVYYVRNWIKNCEDGDQDRRHQTVKCEEMSRKRQEALLLVWPRPIEARPVQVAMIVSGPSWTHTSA